MISAIVILDNVLPNISVSGRIVAKNGLPVNETAALPRPPVDSICFTDSPRRPRPATLAGSAFSTRFAGSLIR
jgi:hypothetical protein